MRRRGSTVSGYALSLTLFSRMNTVSRSSITKATIATNGAEVGTTTGKEHMTISNKEQRQAQAAINAIMRGLALQLKKMLQRQIEQNGPDLIVHAKAGRGFRLHIQVTDAEGNIYHGENPEQDVTEVKQTLQLMKNDPAAACANCGHARKLHSDRGCDAFAAADSPDAFCRCDRFFEPGELM